ncbi:tyrosinase family protein [Bradyrhizobium sp. CCBAU 11430]|uniref:tyrosinase family protein n=1 Tax=Bradyrhizobium sp. CCBAU 11430 TaxID=1630881 RepID=UPI003FA40B84
MPQIFTEGTDASNLLRHPRANDSINSGALSRSPFEQKALLPASPADWRKCFSVPLELDPHGAVHDLVGGDMGNIRASAKDPVFWVHHANIDRLWTVWTKMAGHTNPNDTRWKQKKPSRTIRPRHEADRQCGCGSPGLARISLRGRDAASRLSASNRCGSHHPERTANASYGPSSQFDHGYLSRGEADEARFELGGRRSEASAIGSVAAP